MWVMCNGVTSRELKDQYILSDIVHSIAQHNCKTEQTKVETRLNISFSLMAKTNNHNSTMIVNEITPENH